MKEKDKHIIKQLINYCNRIYQHLEYFGNNRDEYMTNLAFKDACALVIIQIGEHVNRLSDEFKEEYDEMPWSEIIGMRIIHAHNYDSVINEIVWESIQDEIPN